MRERSSPGRHIAYLLPDLAGAGTTTQGFTICAGLERAGYEMDLVVGRQGGALSRDLPPALRVVALAPEDRIMWAPRRHVHEVRELSRYLRRERPAVLISGAKSMNLKALAACRLARAPTRLVLTLTNDLYHDRSPANPGRWLSMSLIRRAYLRADRVVTLSRAMAEDLVHEHRMPSELFTVIPPPLDGDRIDRLAAAPVEHPWLVEKRMPVVLAVGRLTRQKGWEPLLDAFAAAARVRPLRLLALGDGSPAERAQLDRRCRELGVDHLVSFWGFDPNPYRFMRRADLFVLASAWEGFGIVLAEALACGCPVVSTDCRYGPREILAEGRFGRLVDVGDVRALAGALLAQLEVSPPRARLRERAGTFAVDRICDRYDALISQLVS